MIGSREYTHRKTDEMDVAGFAIADRWDVFSHDADHYVLCTKIAGHVTLLEFNYDGDAMVMGREWQRRPRNDMSYSLSGKPRKYHGMKQPMTLTQKLRIE